MIKLDTMQHASGGETPCWFGQCKGVLSVIALVNRRSKTQNKPYNLSSKGAYVKLAKSPENHVNM